MIKGPVCKKELNFLLFGLKSWATSVQVFGSGIKFHFQQNLIIIFHEMVFLDKIDAIQSAKKLTYICTKFWKKLFSGIVRKIRSYFPE